MRDYELVYIVSPLVTEEDLGGVVEKVTQFISSHGGQVHKVDSWGKRKLAYPIRAFREGTYFLTHFKLDPTLATDLENTLRTAEEIIRHLLVRLEQAQTQQEVQTQLEVQTRQEATPETS